MKIRKMTCPRCKLVYEVIIEGKIQRSNRQNKYFHGVVLPILSEHTGYSEEEMKDLVKSMFLKTEIGYTDKNGEYKTAIIVRASHELKTDEFEKFMEKIRIWAASEFGLSIPNPKEQQGDEGEPEETYS